MNSFFYDFFIFLYTFFIKLASFWNEKARLWINGRKEFPTFSSSQKKIWMHCASLGEFEQGRPVLESFRKQFPQHQIVLSFFSPSGFEIRKNYAGADYVIYLPSDTKKNAERLIKAINPELVIWVKYEYWFHFLSSLKKNKIPTLLISGIFRPNQPFFKWYGNFWREMLNCFTHIFVQNQESVQLLQSIHKTNLSVSGDTRFDRVADIAKNQNKVNGIADFIDHHFSIIAGSTWPEDERLLADFISTNNQIKFIIAPHEINASKLLKLKEQLNTAVFYSEWIKISAKKTDSNVLIIDNVGMLSKLYHYGNLAYVGGGFNKSGIHNLLEAAVYGKPVIIGPNYKKFQEAIDLIKIGGAFSIKNSLELNNQLELFYNKEELIIHAGKLSKDYVALRKGASNLIMNYVTENRLLTN